MMFSDSLSGNMADVLRGAQEVRGTSFPIIGGSSTDNFTFQKTYQYLNNSIYTDSVVSTTIGGNIQIGTGHAHGWNPIGRPHQITKSSSNIIKEIDRKRPIELYEEYLGKNLQELNQEGISKLGSSYPLGMLVKGKKDYFTRTPLKIDKTGSLTLSAEFPMQGDINLMIGDKDRALEAAEKAATESLEGIKRSGIKFALVFSNISRFLLLRKDFNKEIKIIKGILGSNIPIFGCCTCGEYSPATLRGYSGQSHFHNQAVSITLFSY